MWCCVVRVWWRRGCQAAWTEAETVERERMYMLFSILASPSCGTTALRVLGVLGNYCTPGFPSTLSMHAHPTPPREQHHGNLPCPVVSVRSKVCTHAPVPGECSSLESALHPDNVRAQVHKSHSHGRPTDANTREQTVCLAKRDEHRIALRFGLST